MSPQYFAGLFDGEGCVGFYRCSKQWRLEVQVCMTSVECVEALHARYGGSVCLRKHKTNKLQYSWKLNAKAATLFLEDVKPYLLEKKAQAELALKAYTYQKQTPRTSDRAVVLDGYVEQLKKLKI